MQTLKENASISEWSAYWYATSDAPGIDYRINEPGQRAIAEAHRRRIYARATPLPHVEVTRARGETNPQPHVEFTGVGAPPPKPPANLLDTVTARGAR